MPIKLRRSYVDTRVFAALAVLAVFSVVSTIVTIGAVQKMLSARQTGVVDSNVRVGLMGLMTTLTGAESSQRGYLLTGDPTYLAPYNSAIKTLPNQLSQLREQASGTSYATDVAALTPLVKSKLVELTSTVSAYQASGEPAALAIVQAGEGQSIMDKLRSDNDTVTARVTSDINVTRDQVNHYAHLANDVGLLALAGTLIVVIGIYFLFDHAIEAEHKLDRAKDEFVALASHQLRTPATGIKSILSMLGQGDFGPLSERQASVVDKAIMSNERELAIIEELLNVAKADAGRLVLKPAQIDVVALVEQIVGEQRPAIMAKNQKLIQHWPDAPVFLMADEEKLYMAISNLLDNARKYTPDEGKITVSIGFRRGHVEVIVADSGIGIEEADLAHIFDRFQRARLVLAGTIEGTGLGLYLARRIAELHHGTISVDSKKGHGSRFTMALPQRTA